ncbi:MAG: hypothetical protein WC998_07830 [Candidatus Paceibacterota bacterium]|jgi:hypothetical protein
MRLPFGLTIERTHPQSVLADAPSEGSVRGASGIAVSTRSYDDPLKVNRYIRNADELDLRTYEILANGIPFIDVSLRKLSRMIPAFTVECTEESTAEALRQWLKTVRINGAQRGFKAFSRPYTRQALQFGRTAGEIVVGKGAKSISDLYTIDAKQLRLLPANDGDGLLIGEETNLGELKAYPRQDLIVYSACNNEGDDPLGVSILRPVPFVADILLRMESAVRQKWQRHGAPSFLLNYHVDADAAVSDATIAGQKDAIKADWEKSMRARWNQEGIIDFVAATQGTFTLTAITDGQELSFDIPYRAMMEQIIASVELAPFMLGVQWATTEGLSEQQADVISGMIQDVRDELEPDFLHILWWAQAVLGLKGDVSLKWRNVNLRDSHKQAMASYWQSKAEEAAIQTTLLAWNNGWLDQERAAEQAGYDPEQLAYPLDLPRQKLAGDVAQDVEARQSTTQPPGGPPTEAETEAASALVAAAHSEANALWAQYP